MGALEPITAFYTNKHTYTYPCLCKISGRNTYIHNESRENNSLQRDFKGCWWACNRVKNFINERIEEICSHEKLFVEEVIYFIH